MIWPAVQCIAFLRENVLHAPAVAGGDAGFIGFNRAGNGVGAEFRLQHASSKPSPSATAENRAIDFPRRARLAAGFKWSKRGGWTVVDAGR